MRVPISWLTTYIELRVPVDTLAERLTLAGLQVEAIDHAGSETVLTLAVTPNRPDWLSLVGVAREAAAGGCGRFKQPSFTAPKGGEATGQWLTVHVKDLVRCPRYAARVIDGVRIGPAPAEAQGRLLAAGIRPINNVVDATNYVMLELGQPLHAFDWRFLRGRQLIVRRSEAGLSFITLDGVERRLSPDDLLICDATGPVALAGIMGGANSEIRGETTRVVLESAYFAPQGIRRTSRRLGLSSESSRRFERGVDPARIDMALHRVTALIVAWAGGTPSADWVDRYPRPVMPRSILLQPDAVDAAIGMPLPRREMAKIFTRLGCRVSLGRKWRVHVPTSRPDLAAPIDLIEEVARLRGYDRIPERLPRGQLVPGLQPQIARLRGHARTWLIAQGFTETLAYAFCSAAQTAQFDVGATPLALQNPLGQEPAVLTTSLAPGLIEAAQLNCRNGRSQGRLFQIRRVFKVGADGAPEEIECIGGVLIGARKSMTWTSAQDMIDFYDVKGVVTGLLQVMGVEGWAEGTEGLPVFLHPGQACRCLFNETPVGMYGCLSPATRARYELTVPVGYFELALSPPVAIPGGEVRYSGLPRFPGVRRDVALLVDTDRPAGTVATAIRRSGPPWLASVTLFDVYQGGRLPAGKKSLAFALYYQDPERTLTDEDVNAAHQAIVEGLKGTVGAQIR